MKLTGFISMAAIAALSAVSCEQSTQPDVEPAKAVAGTYTGYSTAEFQYSPDPMIADGQSLTVTEETSETVTVSYTSDTWGSFTITGATVAESSGTYTITGSGVTVMGMSADSQSEYECTLTATVNGSDDFTFVFDVPAVMGGLKITFLPGEAPSTEDPEEPALDEAVSGDYNGYSAAEFQYSPDPMYTGSQTVTVEAEGEGTVSVSYVSDTWGSFTITGATVAESNGTYTITGSGVTVMGMSAESQSEYECTLEAEITDTENFSFVFNVPAVMGGLTITVLPGTSSSQTVISGDILSLVEAGYIPAEATVCFE